jgi:rubrerythrin
MSSLRFATEREAKLFMLFKQAVEGEQAAQKLYHEARALCDDPQLAAVLERFEKQEQEHEQFLQQQYKHLKAEFLAVASAEDGSDAFASAKETHALAAVAS